jgi:predicted HTH transcriptional regulator
MNDQLKRLQADDIANVVRDKIEESLTLEFKRDLNLKSEHDKREAAKDVSGMANAAGGRIIYGIEEAEVGETGAVSSGSRRDRMHLPRSQQSSLQ